MARAKTPKVAKVSDQKDTETPVFDMAASQRNGGKQKKDRDETDEDDEEKVQDLVDLFR